MDLGACGMQNKDVVHEEAEVTYARPIMTADTFDRNSPYFFVFPL